MDRSVRQQLVSNQLASVFLMFFGFVLAHAGHGLLSELGMGVALGGALWFLAIGVRLLIYSLRR